MIQVAVRHINSEDVELLRAWLDQVDGPRRDVAIATLVDEGVSHEMVLLIKGSDGPVVIYVMEVEDVAGGDLDVSQSHAHVKTGAGRHETVAQRMQGMLGTFSAHPGPATA